MDRQQLAEVIADAFNQFVDVDGNLTLERFHLVMTELGGVWSAIQVEQLFAKIDVDSSGRQSPLFKRVLLAEMCNSTREES